MVILNQNDLRMKKWCRNDRDENPPKMTYFLPNDQGMTHFSHSDVIPSFEDEDEWDEVDQFPYRESLGKQETQVSSMNKPVRDGEFCVGSLNDNLGEEHW